MEILAILSFVLCAVSVVSQTQSLTPTTDCAPLFEACDQEYEASQKDMVQVNDFYQCLKRIQGCDFVQNEERERRIVELKTFVANVCPICRLGEKVWATPAPNPDEMPLETCENQIFSCTTHNTEIMTRVDMLHEAFGCVQRPMECSSHEEFLRQAVTNSIVTEMAMVCPDCLVPNAPPPTYMGDGHPEDMSCKSVLTLCNAKFNVKESNYWSFESLYMCLAKISNCESDLEKTLRQQQMDVLAMTLRGMCPNCTMPTPAPPAQQTCLESVYHCSTHAIEESFTVRHNALRKVHECAMELDECDSTEENNLRFHLVRHVRMEMEMECGHCDRPHIPADVMDSIDNAMLPEHHTCMESITSCQSIFNIRPRGQRRYEEMYHCVQRDENCTPEEMERMEEETAEEEHLLRRRKRSAPLSVIFNPQPSPNEEAMELPHQCHYHITGCKQEFQTTPATCRSRLAYLTCLTTPSGCRVREEQMRMLYISEQFAGIQKECMPRGVNSVYEAEWPSSCFTAFSSCSRAFYSSTRNQRNAKQFYQCLRQPQGCSDWEESYRQEMLQAALNYTPSPGIKHESTYAGT